ncbi:hypothetical protein [Chryseobacterium shigense]|uniref:Uncharacterized protein n=1 Tax=Chryseobacterium shigense TaxID=297244 RepID=A0A841NAU7_9FLAO|nr:hypothetical protein [Chryseobacterium shigense]MBB6369122.1 hypothetical protein [Chryseobacterium shigense]
MKFSIQQLKPEFPFYKRASLLLFILLTSLRLDAQVFSYLKDTQITIDKNTVFYIVDSGNVDQARVKNFEKKPLTAKPSSNDKYAALNKKRSGSTKNEKLSVSKHSEKKVKTYPQAKPIEFVQLNPDNFFSAYQKGIAISAGASTQYDSKFLIENIRFKPLPGYSMFTNHEIRHSNSDILKNYYLSHHTTRPPPFEFYFKEQTFLTI